MRIGICSHITMASCAPFLCDESRLIAAKIECESAPSVDALLEGLLAIGHDVVLFTLSSSVGEITILNGPRLRIYVCPRRTRARTLALTFFHNEVLYLRKAISYEHLDVIHAQWTYEYALGILGANCPKLVTVRDVAEIIWLKARDWYRFFRCLLNSWVFMHRRAIRFVANSPYTAKEVSRFHSGIQCKIIPNSVMDKFILSEFEKNRRPIIMSVSTGISRWKNIPILFEAFQFVRRRASDAELWLVGGSFTESSEFIEKIRGQHSDWLTGVRLLGAVPHEQLVNYYRQAMILMHPSLEETFGNVLLEAMGCGAVAIGGASSGAVPWVLDGGRAGVLCDVTDPEDIATKILLVMSDSELRCRLAAAGNRRVGECFTGRAVARQTVAYYEEVMHA